MKNFSYKKKYKDKKTETKENIEVRVFSNTILILNHSDDERIEEFINNLSSYGVSLRKRYKSPCG